MARLSSLEVENFKSFGKSARIGPFEDFSAIIGPNGAGKSNVMDAICFVLGMRSQKLRSATLRDFIHRSESEIYTSPLPPQARVRLELSLSDQTSAAFERLVTEDGASIYRVQGSTVSHKAYQEELSKFGLKQHVRNFLIFQNEVELMASKTPKQLSELVEKVSGSSQLQEKFDEAKTRSVKAEDEVTFLFQKKRGLAAAKKQLRDQKIEADRFESLRKEHDALEDLTTRFRLYHLSEDYAEQLQDVERRKADLEISQSEVDSLEAQLQDMRKKCASARLDEASSFRAQRAKESEKNQLEASIRQVQAEITGIGRKIRKLGYDETVNEHRESQRLVRAMEAEISNLEDAIAALELESSGTASRMHMSDHAQETFSRLKAEYEVKACDLNRDMQRVERKKRSQLEKLSVLQERLSRLEGEQTRASSQLERLSSLCVHQSEHVARLQALVVQKDTELNHAWNSLSEKHRQQQDLLTNVNRLRTEMSEKSDHHTESANRQKMDEIIDAMKRLFPGVRGRLSELCRPSHQQYAQAVEVILGSLLDGIVVDSNSTAEECIMYLKDQRVGRATFLPLSGLRVDPLPPSLRDLGGTVCPAVDVISCDDPQVRPAILYAAGRALICETLTEARKVRFGEQPIRVKICSLDGTVIGKDGFITGGRTKLGRPSSWSESSRRQMTNRLQTVTDRLHALESEAAVSASKTLPRLEEELRELRQQLELSCFELATEEAKKEDAERLAKSYAESMTELTQAEDITKNKVSRTDSRISLLSEALDAVARETLGPFLDEHGFNSIKEAEESLHGRGDELSARERQLTLKKHQLSAQIEYERSRRLDEKLTRLKSVLEAAQKTLHELEISRETLSSEMDSKKEVIDQMTAHTRQCAENRAKMEQSEAKIKAKVHAQADVTAKKRKILCIAENKAAHTMENMLETLRAMSLKSSNVGTFAADNATEAAEALCNNLGRADRVIRNPEEQTAWLGDNERRMAELKKEMNSVAPNLRAVERLRELETQISDANADFAELRAKAVQANRDYENVRRQRQKKFLECFRFIAKRTSEVYKELTSSKSYPDGGTAYLSLESDEDPFLRGIKFNAMPPTKRFRDMEQLSGGERTIAALALLFAVHDFKPTPFLIMDEADAALDNRNVDSVSRFIRSRSTKTQVIVISLKDTFYWRADVLLGVFRDRQAENASQVIHFSLLKRFQSISFESDASETDSGRSQAAQQEPPGLTP